MITDESIKRHVLTWVAKVGSTNAVERLKRKGVGERMARYLVAGKYHHNISLKKAEQIARALR